jgi:DNA mismatch repair protein MutL
MLQEQSKHLSNEIKSEYTFSTLEEIAKELVDNSLDAKATSITIEITSNEGVFFVITDNGIGIPKKNFPLLCTRDFTSKNKEKEFL